MEIRIRDMSETKRGIQISAYIYHPIRDDVHPLGDRNGKTQVEIAAQLEKWTHAAKEANKKYSKELSIYRRVHLGHAKLIQEVED